MKKSTALVVLATLLFTALTVSALPQFRSPSTHRHSLQGVAIHLFPHELNSRDQLTDGQSERAFRLHDNTLLIWVDLEPGARFTHSTAYVLISPEEVRVEQGLWWPALNGRRILEGRRNNVAVASPFRVNSLDKEPVDVYFYSGELSPGDILRDGPSEKDIPITCPTFFAWVDTLPGLFFTHPTLHILIGADKAVRIVDGGWWPELNGKMILHGARDKYGVSTPFRLLNLPTRP